MRTHTFHKNAIRSLRILITMALFVVFGIPSTKAADLLTQNFTTTSGYSSSGWTRSSGTTYNCGTAGDYCMYASTSSGNYLYLNNFHVPRGKGVSISFSMRRFSGSATMKLYARVGGYGNWNTSSNHYSGWIELNTSSLTYGASCATQTVTVPGDICGGQDLCILFKASAYNSLSIDNIVITDGGPASTVPNIGTTPWTCTFDNSPYAFYAPVTNSSNYTNSGATNIFSYHSCYGCNNSSGAATPISNTGSGNGGRVNTTGYSGYYTYVNSSNSDCSNPGPSGKPSIITKEFNTSTCTGTTATLRFAFKQTYSTVFSDEDYTLFCPKVYYMNTSDVSGYSWTQATVNYYFPNGKWWYATTSLPKSSYLIVAFCPSTSNPLCYIDDIKIVNNDCAICTQIGGAISCTSDPGLNTYTPNTPYTFTTASTTGATYYKWIIRDLTTAGNPIYYGTAAGATPAVTSGQGTQNVTINFGTNTGNDYRVMCIPYDENYGTDNAPTDACYAKISIYSDLVPACIPPTLSGASQASAVCGSGSATINLTGMVPNSTGNAIDYTINGVAQTQVTGINANASGNASFSTSSLTTANNGQALVITKITNGSCFTNFTQNVTLQVASTPTLTGASQAAAICGSDPATINLTGMVANSTGNAIDYTINGVAQPQVTGIYADASGNASFNTAMLSTTNNGQPLVITKITNGNCFSNFSQSLNSNLQVVAFGYWTGNVDTNWDTQGNWSCNTIPTSNIDVTIPGSTPNQPIISGTAECRALQVNGDGVLTINPTGTLTAFGNTTLTSNAVPCFMIKSDATGTGSFIDNGSVSGSGTSTMQRYMLQRLGYHYYSSPFINAPISEFADEMGPIITDNPYIGDDLNNNPPNFPNFFQYIETKPHTLMDIGWDAAGPNLETMKGYCINFGSSTSSITTDISGRLYSGAPSISVTNTYSGNPASDGWNLVGNPYPSSVDWNAWTNTNVNNAIYYFKPGSQYGGSYKSYVNGQQTNDASNIIGSMQGFFISAKIGGGTLTVANNARVHNINAAFYKTLSNTPSLRLKGYNASNTVKADETVIYFDPLATFMFDGNLDAYKMLNNDPTYPNIFSRDSSIYSLSISALPPLSNTDVVIPLGFTTKTSGTYRIEATEMLNFDPSLHIYLEDNQTSTIQDLTLNPQYTFSINVNDPLYRFFIRFSPSILTGIEENGSSFAEAWSSGKDIFVNYSNPASQKTEISIYNMLGQKVISSEQAAIGTSQFTIEEPGCYIVNLISGSKIYQKKVVIL